MMDFMGHLHSAHRSLFCFEVLQDGALGDRLKFYEEFLRKGSCGLSFLQEWNAFVGGKTAYGIPVRRVRLIRFPLTNYTKFALHTYQASAKVGEDTWVIADEDFDKLGIPSKDFWLIDEHVVLSLEYDSAGNYLQCHRQGGVSLAYAQYARDLLSSAVPLGTFLSAVNGKA